MFRLTLAAALALAAAAPAQNADYFAFLSDKPDLKADAGKGATRPPVAPTFAPNGDGKLYLYVRKDDQNLPLDVTVRVLAGETVLAEGKAKPDPVSTARVAALTAVAKPEKPDAGIALPSGPDGYPTLRLQVLDGTTVLFDSKTTQIPFAAADSYVKSADATYTSATRSFRLRLTPADDIPAPALVQLDLSRVPGLDAEKTTGVLKDTLSAGKPVTPSVNLVFAPGAAVPDEFFISASVAGVPRAVMYRVSRDGDNTQRVNPSGLRVALPKRAFRPDEAFVPTVEVDRPPQGAERLVLTMSSADGRSPVQRFHVGPRERGAAVKVEADALAVKTVERDWRFEGADGFDIRDALRGRFQLVAELQGGANNVRVGQPSPAVTVVIDSSAPAVSFVKPLKRAVRGKPYTARVTAQDAESDIDAVEFFAGPVPPTVAGQPAPKGIAAKKVGNEWVATLSVPSDTKDELTVTARATNGVNLPTDSKEVVTVVAPSDVGGSVKVTVKYGNLLQPNTEVALVNADRKAVKAGKTDKDGVFVFEEVDPGQYTVGAAQPGKGLKGANHLQTNEDGPPSEIKVVKGKTSVVEVKLSR